MTRATSTEQRGWNDQLPSEKAYKARPGLSRDKRTAEQDEAVGGRHRRAVPLPNGQYARASVQLRLYQRTRRIRAYLRWSVSGQTEERYVCDVNEATRSANLALAWRRARTAGMVVDEPLPPESSASSVAVRAVMRANRGRDTKPELLLRAALHRAGLRYRVDIRPLPNLRRRADVVFPRAKVAVFVDGCFWHGCPEHHRPAKRNAEKWAKKIQDNRDRDAATTLTLENQGWFVLRFWEHEDPEQAATTVQKVVNERRSTGLTGPST